MDCVPYENRKNDPEASGFKDPVKLIKRNDEAMGASSSLSGNSICILTTDRRQLRF